MAGKKKRKETPAQRRNRELILNLTHRAEAADRMGQSLEILSRLTRDIWDRTKNIQFKPTAPLVALDTMRLAFEMKRLGHKTWDLDNLIDHLRVQAKQTTSRDFHDYYYTPKSVEEGSVDA